VGEAAVADGDPAGDPVDVVDREDGLGDVARADHSKSRGRRAS
jgi:hypothetical protein